MIVGIVPRCTKPAGFIDNPEANGRQAEQSPACLLGVQAFPDEPADTCSLGFTLSCAFTELRRAQLHFKTVRALMDEDVCPGRWVFGGCGVPEACHEAAQVQLHPLMLRTRWTTTAMTIRCPVVA